MRRDQTGRIAHGCRPRTALLLPITRLPRDTRRGPYATSLICAPQLTCPDGRVVRVQPLTQLTEQVVDLVKSEPDGPQRRDGLRVSTPASAGGTERGHEDLIVEPSTVEEF